MPGEPLVGVVPHGDLNFDKIDVREDPPLSDEDEMARCVETIGNVREFADLRSIDPPIWRLIAFGHRAACMAPQLVKIAFLPDRKFLPFKLPDLFRAIVPTEEAPRVAELIVKKCKNASRSYMACALVAAIGQQEALVDKIGKIFERADSNRRQTVAEGIGLLCGAAKKLVPALLDEVSRGERGDKCIKAVAELGLTTAEDARIVLSVLNSHKSSYNRAAAAKALGSYDDEDVLSGLLVVLENEEDVHVKSEIVRALGRFGPGRAFYTLPVIQKMLPEHWSDMKNRCLRESPQRIQADRQQLFFALMDAFVQITASSPEE